MIKPGFVPYQGQHSS